MPYAYDKNAGKKSANLSINQDLLKQAKDQKINLSATLEHALEEKLAQKEAERWAREHSKGIAAFNKLISDHGCFGEEDFGVL